MCVMSGSGNQGTSFCLCNVKLESCSNMFGWKCGVDVRSHADLWVSVQCLFGPAGVLGVDWCDTAV